MISLLFTVCYILFFEVFQIEMNYFMLIGTSLLILYRTYRKEAVQFFGFLNVYSYMSIRVKNIPGVVACLLFCGYHLWRTGLFAERWEKAIFIYLMSVVANYFISFQEGTQEKKRVI